MASSRFPLRNSANRLLQLAADDNFEHDGVKKWPALVVVLVGLQHDLLVRLPPDKFERSGSHRRAPEAISQPFHLFLRDYRGIGQPQDRQDRGQWLLQNHLKGITINCFQPPDALRFPLHEILGPLDMLEEIGHRPWAFGIEETGEGVDEIVRRHLPTMMKRDPSAQGKGPGAAILRSFPKLGNGGNQVEVRIELDQSIEDLADDGAAIDIGHEGGIERGGIVAQHPAERPPELCPRHFQLWPSHGFRRSKSAVYEQIAADPQRDQRHHASWLRHLPFLPHSSRLFVYGSNCYLSCPRH